MNKVIRILVGGLALCGVLAVLPGVAEAREANRPAAGHVERERGHERGREYGREHGGRGEHGRWHEGRGRWEHRGAGRPAC